MRHVLPVLAVLAALTVQAQERKGDSDRAAPPEAVVGSDRFPVEVDGKWGYVDRRGDLVVQPAYDQAWPFREGRGRVLRFGRFGFVDAAGELAVPLRFDDAYDFSGGRARVVQFEAAYNAKSRRVIASGRKLNGFVGADGEVLVTPQYVAGRDFADSVAPVLLAEGARVVDLLSLFRRPTTWVGIGPDGARVFETDAADVGRFSEGRAAFVTRGSLFSPAAWGYLGTDGAETIRPQFSRAHAFSGGLACVGIDGRAGFIEPGGALTIEPDFLHCGDFVGGIAPVQDADSHLWGYIDTSGEWRVPPQFSYADALSEGVALVQMPDGRFGFIGADGAFVLAPIYDWARAFDDGLAYVRQGDVEGYIGQSGTFVWQKLAEAAVPPEVVSE